MKAPTLMQMTHVPVADVICRSRLRPVSEAGVESLIASITETGVMKDAIHIRKKKDGGLHLIAGAHRLEAARRLGWAEIEAKVWTDVTDDWSRIMEIDDNLAGAEMNALDTAVFLATRKEVYERLHPETKRGIAGGLARHGLASDILSFAESVSEKFGTSKRTVERLVAAGSALHADQIARLRAAPRPVSLKDLQDIAKISQPTDRNDVVDRLAEGRAKSAAEALRALKSGAAASFKDPVEEAFKALSKAFDRAPKAALRRFVEEHFDRLSPLVVDEAERRDAAEVTAIRATLPKGMAAE